MSENVFTAKKTLNDFLRHYPELHLYKKHVEHTLNKAGSNHNRIVVINRMIHDTPDEFKNQFLNLQKDLEILSK